MRIYSLLCYLLLYCDVMWAYFLLVFCVKAGAADMVQRWCSLVVNVVGARTVVMMLPRLPYFVYGCLLRDEFGAFDLMICIGLLWLVPRVYFNF